MRFKSKVVGTLDSMIAAVIVAQICPFASHTMHDASVQALWDLKKRQRREGACHRLQQQGLCRHCSALASSTPAVLFLHGLRMM